jgi:hypothetical protein
MEQQPAGQPTRILADLCKELRQITLPLWRKNKPVEDNVTIMNRPHKDSTYSVYSK